MVESQKIGPNLFQNAIDNKVKDNLCPSDMLRNIDQHVFCGRQFLESTKSSYEVVKIKNPIANKPKARSYLQALEQIDKAFDKARKEKKKDRCNCSQDCG